MNVSGVGINDTLFWFSCSPVIIQTASFKAIEMKIAFSNTIF